MNILNMIIAPELIVALTGFVVLITDLFIEDKKRHILGPIALIGILLASVSVCNLLPETSSMFGGRFVFDPVAGWFKLFFLLGAAFTVIFCWQSKAREKLPSTGEFYSVLMFTVVGMMFIISARDLITLYISLELATIPLFALAAWRKGDKLSGEAGLKYVIFGALASGLLLYGLGLLYGLSGSADLLVISQTITDSPALWLAGALILAGIGFKITMFPFHIWAADVYQGAPTVVTAYLSVASKSAGMAFMFQILFGIFGNALSEYGWLIAALATATMTLGNLVAIVQNNIKRFMAFSAISQAGYIILGFLGPFSESVPSMLFYLFIYVFTNMAVFGVIIYYSDTTGKEEIDDYKGLSRTNPAIAFVMMIGLFSLAGIPPLSGFVGKFFLFSIAAKAGYHWLVAVAAINSTVSLYYYLRIIRQMYMEPPAENAKKLPISKTLALTFLLTTLAVILLGVIPHVYETIQTQTTNWLPTLNQLP